jgi:hypothetical protein
MIKRTWLLLLLAVILALGLVACSPNKETTATDSSPIATDETPVAEAVEPTTEPATESVAVEPAPPAAETHDEAVRPPDGVFSGAAVALAELNSYRYSMLFTFVGEADGEIEGGSLEVTGVVAGPDRKHLSWRDLWEDRTFEVVRIDDRAWIFDDAGWRDAPILVADAMSQAVLVYAPSIAWDGMFGELEQTAIYVGVETVNGVSADHYTATYEQWTGYWSGELEDASGDVWIAEAGYPVKYNFSATGIDQDGNRGTVTWRMDLTDVNTEITIEPPDLGAPGS